MTPKYRFGLRVLLYSVPLYVIGQKLLRGYAAVLTQGVLRAGARHAVPNNVADFLYAPSMTMIAYCALVLATPQVSIPRRLGMVCVGIVTFVFADLMFLEYLKVAAPLSDGSVVIELYLCVKSLLACVLWMAMGLPQVAELLRPAHERAH